MNTTDTPDHQRILTEIESKLRKAGYSNSEHVSSCVSMLIYERDTANQECEKLRAEIRELKADVHQPELCNEEIARLREELLRVSAELIAADAKASQLEYDLGIEKEQRATACREFIAANAKVEELELDARRRREVFQQQLQQIAQLTKERDEIKDSAYSAYREECEAIHANHEAELAKYKGQIEHLTNENDSLQRQLDHADAEYMKMRDDHTGWMNKKHESEVAKLKIQIEQLTKERDEAKQHASVVLTACQKTVARDTASREAELASVLTQCFKLTKIGWYAPPDFTEKLSLQDRFRWDGSRFVPVDHIVDDNKMVEPAYVMPNNEDAKRRAELSAELRKSVMPTRQPDCEIVETCKQCGNPTSKHDVGCSEFEPTKTDERPVTVGVLVKVLRNLQFGLACGGAEAEMASVLTACWDNYCRLAFPETFLEGLELETRFLWDGSRFVPVRKEVNQMDEIIGILKQKEEAEIENAINRMDQSIPSDRPATVRMLANVLRNLQFGLAYGGAEAVMVCRKIADAIEKEDGL